MAWSFAFLLALVVLSCTPCCSLGRGLPRIHTHGNRRAMTVLGQMRRTSHFSCLKERKNFGMSWGDFDGKQVQKTQVISALHVVNQQILNFFCTNDSSAAWETTLLDKFCSALYQQLNDLQVFLMQQVGVKEGPLLPQDSLVPVRKYFQRITVYLKEKRYSPCAWEVVRAEMLRALSSSASLIERLRKETSQPWPGVEMLLVD